MSLDNGSATREHVLQLHELAVTAYNSAHYRRAESLLQKACALAQNGKDLNLLVLVKSALASTKHMLRDEKEALAMQAWLISVATNPETSGRLTEEEAFRRVAGAFAGFSDIARQLPETDIDDLLRMLGDGATWMRRIGKPDWSADLRLQRGLILRSQGRNDEARREMEAALAMKRRQTPKMGFTFETHLFQLAELLVENPFRDYEGALDLTDELLSAETRNPFETCNAFEIRGRAFEMLGDCAQAEHAFREMVSIARQTDMIDALTRGSCMLARLLSEQMQRRSEAMKIYRDTIAQLDDASELFVYAANSAAWQMYLAGESLSEAESLARRGWEKDPSDTNVLQTLVAIIVRQQKWHEATALIKEWAQRVDKKYLSNHWSDDLLLFRDAIAHGHGEDCAELLDGELWAPMRMALRRLTRSLAADLTEMPQGSGSAVEILIRQLRGEGTEEVYPLELFVDGSWIAVEC